MSTVESAKPRDPLATLRIQRSEPPRRPGRRRAWVGLLLGLLALTGAGALAVVASQRGMISLPVDVQAVTDVLRPRPVVRIASVAIETGRSAEALVVATGYLESRRQAMIGARAPGRIEVIHFEEGTHVEEAQVLAVLEHADLDAALAAMQATLAQARAQLAEQQIEIARTEREYGRAQRLKESRTITETQFDVARFAYESAVARVTTLEAAVSLAEARVREAEQLKENMYIRAPFDGTVISKDAEVGESILPGGMGEGSGRGSVLTIADLEHLEVDCDVKEDFISRVRIGQGAEVAVDAVPDRRYQGRVRKVIPMGDRARATIKVKVEIVDADERLFPDMSSTVYFLPEADTPTDQRAADERRLFIPSEAVVALAGESRVWQVDSDGRALATVVTLGNENQGRTEVVAGLSGGERVILSPPADLRAGERVEIER